jgi:hypothetical protein
MENNPYAAPAAVVAESHADATGSIRLYSPMQAALGAFFGGPVAVVYFLSKNFDALGKPEGKRWTIIGGILGILLIVVLSIAVPQLPGLMFTLAYVLIAQSVTTKYQMTKVAIAESPVHAFHSNWRVFWLTLLCLVGSLAVLVGVGFAAATLGYDL